MIETAVSSAGSHSARRFHLEFWVRIVLFFICLIALSDWLSCQTERLYLDENSEATRPSTNTQQNFAIRGSKVVPQIITRENAHFFFPKKWRLPHRLVFEVEPEGPSSYEIYLREKTSRRLLTSDKISKCYSRSIWIPRRGGGIEFEGHGTITWSDIRVVRSTFLWPLYAIVILGLSGFGLKRVRLTNDRRGMELLTFAVTALLALSLVELVLRVYGQKLPPVIVAARRDLGLVGPDTRLIDLKRYKQRIRPNLDTPVEWRYGGLVSYGVIPRSASRPVLHRYRFQTDAEGFRNAAVREKIDVAALGDSFTDAAASPAEESWPVQLEKMTGLVVQNFGTSGFGPQQELYALNDYALPRKPHWAVVAFFAGNDLHDAEVFDQWEHAAERKSEEISGWKLTRSFRRYQTLYLWTIASLAIETIRGNSEPAQGRDAAASFPLVPQFKQGLFEIPVGGRTLQFAFLPHYLQNMAVDRAQLERSRGWEITRSTLRQMKADCVRMGSKLLVTFVPSKEQVYWPLVEDAIPARTLQEAIDYYSRFIATRPRLEDLKNNRLALNLILREFCANEEIPMLDLTPKSVEELRAGNEIYFSDDTHWNAAGHRLAAEQLAAFLWSKRP